MIKYKLSIMVNDMSNFAFGSVKESADSFGGNRKRQSDRSFTIVTGMNGQQRIFFQGGGKTV